MLFKKTRKPSLCFGNINLSGLWFAVLFIVMSHRTTTKVPLPIPSIGSQPHLIFHRFGSEHHSNGKAYIQASLHADELPGLLVAHHLINLLEEAGKKQLIAKEIVIVPFANPIGLSQNFMGVHQGRFNIGTGVNFNRSFADVTKAMITKLDGKLTNDEQENVKLIRAAFREELDHLIGPDQDPKDVEDVMKMHLLREACDADVVLDLHCDNGNIFSS